MNKWTRETLMPSLFERFQNRDKKYCEIVISDRIFSILTAQMKADHICYKAEWNGRGVVVTTRGSYHFINFGITAEEQNVISNSAEENALRKDIESAKNTMKRGNQARIQQKKDRYQKLFDSYNNAEDLKDPVFRRRFETYKTILEILEGKHV